MMKGDKAKRRGEERREGGEHSQIEMVEIAW